LVDDSSTNLKFCGTKTTTMTVKELKEALDNFPDDMLVAIEQVIFTSDDYYSGKQSETQLVTTVEKSKLWTNNSNPIIRVHSWQKDCVLIR
jgi:hypothetical protein